MNLGVYVSSFNEERLIKPCVSSIKQVFPEIEVVDLGSTDSTINKVEEVGDIPIHKYTNVSGADWTRLKNEFADKHDWVFFIDGDEIYLKSQLEILKDKIYNGKYHAYRVGWKIIREQDGLFQVSNTKPNRVKAYYSPGFYFKRAWPKEVLQSINENFVKDSSIDVWCYHGVLLKRSSCREPANRRKKRQIKEATYNKILTWTDIVQPPWKES